MRRLDGSRGWEGRPAPTMYILKAKAALRQILLPLPEVHFQFSRTDNKNQTGFMSRDTLAVMYIPRSLLL